MATKDGLKNVPFYKVSFSPTATTLGGDGGGEGPPPSADAQVREPCIPIFQRMTVPFDRRNGPGGGVRVWRTGAQDQTALFPPRHRMLQNNLWG